MKVVFFGDSITDMSRVRNSDGKVEAMVTATCFLLWASC